MSIYEEKFNDLMGLSKEQLIEKILENTPFIHSKDKECAVLEDGTVLFGVDVNESELRDSYVDNMVYESIKNSCKKLAGMDNDSRK